MSWLGKQKKTVFIGQAVEVPGTAMFNTLNESVNPKKIFEVVSNYLDNPKKIDEQVSKTQTILKSFKTNTLSSALAANALNKYL